MTEPQPVMAQAEQDQLTRRVGRSLLTVAGEGWQRVRAEYRSAGRHIEVDVFVTGPDGVEHPVRPPQEVVEGLGRLRQGMYRPGRGTWLSGVYLLEPPSSFSAEFEPDAEPRWRRVPPPIGFADELKFFPRADENIPDWLRQRAGLPPLPAADEPAQGGQPQPTPPAGPPAGPFTGQPGNRPEPGAPAGQFGDRPGRPPQTGEPTPPPGVPAFGGQPGGDPTAGQFGGRPDGGEPTPPRGVPAGPFGGQPPAVPAEEPGLRPGAFGQPNGGDPTSSPGGYFGGRQPAGHPQPGEPTPPPGIPAGPFSRQPQTREAAAPFSRPGGGEPTPPPGIPAGPFSGQPQPQEAAAPFTNQPDSGQPTQPPGIPAGPFSGQPSTDELPSPSGIPAGPFTGQPQHQETASPWANQPDGGRPTPPPGVPADPYAGQQQPQQAPFSRPGSEPGQFGQAADEPALGGDQAGSESWFGGQIAEAEGKPAPRGFGVPATPFPPDEQRR